MPGPAGWAPSVRVLILVHPAPTFFVFFSKSWKTVNFSSEFFLAGQAYYLCDDRHAKFPAGYVFELTNDEANSFAVESFDRKTRSKTRVPPKAFTEKGLYMLATIVKSPIAAETTVAIIEAFAKMRELSRTLGEIATNQDTAEQKSLIRKSGEIMADIIGQDMHTTDVETEIELNFAVLKLKHKIKRKKDKA